MVLHNGPGFLGRGDIRVAVKGDVHEGVAVEQRDQPLEQRDQAG